MAATDANTLLAEAKCYECFGPLSMSLLFRLALEARMLKALVPGADTSPQALITYGKCFNCYGASYGELMELALLDQISQAL